MLWLRLFIYNTLKAIDYLNAVLFRQFLVALACSGSVDYGPCVIGSEISAEAACISNDSVGRGLII